MEEENQRLLQSLLPQTTTNSAVIATSATVSTTTTFSTPSASTLTPLPLGEDLTNKTKTISSNSSIISRLALIIFVGLISIWANYESTKGFSVTIINEAGGTLSGKRFDLFYVSNDEATRIILNASKFIENFLYPSDNYTKKHVGHVTLRLAGRNLSETVVVDSGNDGKYVLHLSPSVIEDKDFSRVVNLAIHKGMSRIWLNDGQNNTPRNLISGIIEYLSRLVVPPHSGVAEDSPEYDPGCWKGGEPRAVGRFLEYCEGRSEGFIRRLNQGMKNGWHDGTMDDALLGEIPAHHLCVAYKSSHGIMMHDGEGMSNMGNVM